MPQKQGNTEQAIGFVQKKKKLKPQISPKIPFEKKKKTI